MNSHVFALCAILAIAAAPLSTLASCPNIVSRSDWGARAPKSTTSLRQSPTPFVVIHHGDSGPCTTQSACSAMAKSYQSQHMNKQWSDIGYNFLIGGDGNAYEGRGWDNQGSHEPKYNTKSIGICFMGSFVNELPTAAALATAKELIACGVRLNKIKSDYKLIGHSQAKATLCPGTTLYNHIQTWENWSNV